MSLHDRDLSSPLSAQDALRVVNRQLSYCQLTVSWLKKGSDPFERRCHLFSLVKHSESLLFAYGAELALRYQVPVIEQELWLIFTRYRDQAMTSAELIELASLEQNSDSWLCTLESLCAQTKLIHMLRSGQTSTDSILFVTGDLKQKEEGKLLSHTRTLSIFDGDCCSVIEHALDEFAELIACHRNNSLEF